MNCRGTSGCVCRLQSMRFVPAVSAHSVGLIQGRNRGLPHLKQSCSTRRGRCWPVVSVAYKETGWFRLWLLRWNIFHGCEQFVSLWQKIRKQPLRCWHDPSATTNFNRPATGYYLWIKVCSKVIKGRTIF